MPDMGYESPRGGGGVSLPVSLEGNAVSAKPVSAYSFSFVSGDDSNVVVTIDSDKKVGNRIKIAIDVYYV